ncbi:MAG TPA: hypothetical protein PK299_12775 [Anaerolineales bacterium]|nr:hypothetical protein [Anaerolineales bacterium]
MTNYRNYLLLSIVFISMFLSGCQLKTEVWLLGKENWKAEQTILLTHKEAILGKQIETRLDDEVANLSSQKIRAKWQTKNNADGTIEYKLITSGQGYSTLNDVIFHGGSTFESLRPGSKGVMISWNQTSNVSAKDTQLIIHAKEIYFSDADIQRETTVSWSNVESGFVALLDAPRYNLTTIVILIALAIVVSTIFIIEVSFKRKWVVNLQVKVLDYSDYSG